MFEATSVLIVSGRHLLNTFQLRADNRKPVRGFEHPS